MAHRSVLLCILAFAGLAACQREDSGLFASRSIPSALPAEAPGETPRFVGRWATDGAGCGQDEVWVIRAKSLEGAKAVPCAFDRVQATSAGYVVATVCQTDGGPVPGRLTLTLSEYGHGRTMTVAGGPFKDAVALQRCPA
jgi:hypothetical protein